MKTYNAKPGEIERDWLIVDAEGKTAWQSRNSAPILHLAGENLELQETLLFSYSSPPFRH